MQLQCRSFLAIAQVHAFSLCWNHFPNLSIAMRFLFIFYIIGKKGLAERYMMVELDF